MSYVKIEAAAPQQPPQIIGETNARGPFSPGARDLICWVGAYCILTFFTSAYFMADTVDYVTGAYQYHLGIDTVFWDFRHLFWRPLLLVLFKTVGATMSARTHSNWITFIYISVAMNWIAGLFSVVLVRALLRQYCRNQWAIDLSTAMFLFSLGFLNYVHAGTSYIPGLALMLLGCYLMSARSETSSRTFLVSFAPALAFCASVCFWFPYVFAVPGALLSPLFSTNRTKDRLRFAVRTSLICLALGLFSYGIVVVHQNIFTLSGLLHWINQGAESVAGVKGVGRAFFGFARSFVEMGNDGLLFKRFLLHDPYNPVTIWQLSRLSVWKLVLFYVLMVRVCLELARTSEGKRILAFFLISSGPLLIFAIRWFGGDVERYLPLYPAFFIAVCFALERTDFPSLKWLAGIFLMVVAISNVAVTSRRVSANMQRETTARIQDLLPLLRPHSRVFELDIHDDLINFSRSFPVNPVNAQGKLWNYPMLNQNTPQTAHWKDDFDKTVAAIWIRGGDVWVSKRALQPRPKAEWSWAEGADPNVTWAGVRQFVSQFDFGQDVGGDDGFVLLLPTSRNHDLISSSQLH